MRLVLMGPPGAGKGTQAAVVAAQLRHPARSRPATSSGPTSPSGTPLGRQARRTWTPATTCRTRSPTPWSATGWPAGRRRRASCSTATRAPLPRSRSSTSMLADAGHGARPRRRARRRRPTRWSGGCSGRGRRSAAGPRSDDTEDVIRRRAGGLRASRPTPLDRGLRRARTCSLTGRRRWAAGRHRRHRPVEDVTGAPSTRCGRTAADAAMFRTRDADPDQDARAGRLMRARRAGRRPDPGRCRRGGRARASRTAELDALAEDVHPRRRAPSRPSWATTGFPASICASVNDEVVHGIPGPGARATGDLVSIDCGAIVDGWHGDAAVTVAGRRGRARRAPTLLRGRPRTPCGPASPRRRPGGRLDRHRRTRSRRRSAARRRLRDRRGLRRPRHRHRDAPGPARARTTAGRAAGPSSARAGAGGRADGRPRARRRHALLDDGWTVVTATARWRRTGSTPSRITDDGPVGAHRPGRRRPRGSAALGVAPARRCRADRRRWPAAARADVLAGLGLLDVARPWLTRRPRVPSVGSACTPAHAVASRRVG